MYTPPFKSNVEQTIYIEYSGRGKTEPFMDIVQTVPAQKRTVLIGRIFRGKNEDGGAAYILTNADGVECFARTYSMSEVRRLFRMNGRQMAEKEIEKERMRENEMGAIRKKNPDKGKER